MIAAGIGMFVLGYAMVYSGLSNLLTGGNGWGFLKSLTGKGGNTPSVQDQSVSGGRTSGTGKPSPPTQLEG